MVASEWGLKEERSWCYRKISFKIYKEHPQSTTHFFTFQELKDAYLQD